MGIFKDIFEGYGADYETTMARFMGSEKTYLRFLDMLFQDDNLQKLGDALRSDDVAGAFEAAHTLKGVASNMGLTPLHQAVCTIVEPLRSKECRDDYMTMYQDIWEEFQRADTLRSKLKGAEDHA